MRYIERLRRIAMESAAVATIVVGVGCAGSMHQTRMTLEVSARALREIDDQAATHYTEAANVALEESDTFAEYEHRMAGWNRLVSVAKFARSALEKAQLAIDSYDEEKEDHPELRSTFGCVVMAFAQLVAALQVVEIPIPDDVSVAIELLQKLGGTCGES